MLMFAVLAHERRRLFRPLLLSLLIMSSWSVHPALADGASGNISNGQPVTGTLTSGTDTYSFNVTAGSAFVLSVSETGTHVAGFVPEIDLAPPGGAGAYGLGRPLHTLLEETNPAEGTWNVSVHRADDGIATGSYALTLIQVPGTIPSSGGIAGGLMAAGATNSGSSTRGSVDVWTFNGVPGQTASLTLTQTDGTGFVPEVHVFAPGGDFAGGFACAKSCSHDFPMKSDGVYTALAWRMDSNDVTGKYTLSVNNKN